MFSSNTSVTKCQALNLVAIKAKKKKQERKWGTFVSEVIQARSGSVTSKFSACQNTVVRLFCLTRIQNCKIFSSYNAFFRIRGYIWSCCRKSGSIQSIFDRVRIWAHIVIAANFINISSNTEHNKGRQTSDCRQQTDGKA